MFILSFISARLSHLNIVLPFWLILGFPVAKYSVWGFFFKCGKVRTGANENLTQPVERKNSVKRGNG